MGELEFEEPLEAAVRYIRKEEAGAEPAFPYDATFYLLTRDAWDEWQSGLYLLSRLPRTAIEERFFHEPSTYRALATFLAADCASREPFLRRLEAAAEYLDTHWHTPEELKDLTLEEFERIGQLLGRMLGIGEQRAVTGAKPLALIVHGTWASNATWWRPNGNFWNYIQPKWPHLYAGAAPFGWSGDNKDGARLRAAKQLVTWVGALGPTSLDVIAHSHGGNVCLLAARLGLNIDRLILLGTPIRTEYIPDLHTIRTIANVFSLGDRVQTPFGTLPHCRFEGRTLGDSASVSNWRAALNGNGNDPGHSDLHEPSTWQASALQTLL